jgi:hypothetical protein
MVDLIEVRVSKLARLSDHYRLLANDLQPDPVSAEINAIANELDTEAARVKRECVGKRRCPCAKPSMPAPFDVAYRL